MKTAQTPQGLPSRARGVRWIVRLLAVGFGSAYAVWLDENEGVHEPDRTWAEVVGGSSATLVLALVDEWLGGADDMGGSGVLLALVYFGLTGLPVIAGEVRQARARRRSIEEYRGNKTPTVAAARRN